MICYIYKIIIIFLFYTVNYRIIIFNIGGDAYTSTINEGTATYNFTTTQDDYGKQITATTQSNAYYNEATSNTIQLDKGDTLLTLTQEENNETVIITATITDINNNPITTGSITFTDDADMQTIVMGDMPLIYTTTKSDQDKTITVTFQDNEVFNINSQEILVKAREPEYTLKVDTTSFTIGQLARIKASIYLGEEVDTTINRGKVTFKVNGKTLKDENGKVIYVKVVNGTASIDNYEIPDSWVEGSIIQAVYSGSADCQSLKSDKQTITLIPEEVTLSLNDMTATHGETIHISIRVMQGQTPVNTGKVIVKINGKTVKDANGKVIYAKVVNGTGSVEYTIPENMKAGRYNITVLFTAPGYDKLVDTKTLTVSA